MAGASYWDLMLTYGIGRSTCYSIFREVLTICDSYLMFEGLPPKEDIAAYKRRAIDFAISRRNLNLLPGCVGALDGTLIFFQKPSKELSNQQFYTRKGGFGVPVQALVDAKYRCIASSAVCVGSTVDAVVFAHSNIDAQCSL
ncbi:DDE endonuclease [Gracilaria domingensis]|nr:DDE endonuclease [Gracilaria domingensis]